MYNKKCSRNDGLEQYITEPKSVQVTKCAVSTGKHRIPGTSRNID